MTNGYYTLFVSFLIDLCVCLMAPATYCISDNEAWTIALLIVLYGTKRYERTHHYILDSVQEFPTFEMSIMSFDRLRLVREYL